MEKGKKTCNRGAAACTSRGSGPDKFLTSCIPPHFFRRRKFRARRSPHAHVLHHRTCGCTTRYLKKFSFESCSNHGSIPCDAASAARTDATTDADHANAGANANAAVPVLFCGGRPRSTVTSATDHASVSDTRSPLGFAACSSFTFFRPHVSSWARVCRCVVFAGLCFAAAASITGVLCIDNASRTNAIVAIIDLVVPCA